MPIPNPSLLPHNCVVLIVIPFNHGVQVDANVEKLMDDEVKLLVEVVVQALSQVSHGSSLKKGGNFKWSTGYADLLCAVL